MNPRRIIASMFRGAESVADEAKEPINLALAFCLSPLPRRYWRGADGVGILLSAFVQAGVSLAGFTHAYTAYAHQVSDAIADATLKAAVNSGAERIGAAPAMAFGALTPLGFFAVSWPAWILAYGLLSGIIRALGYAADHPCGDPILTFVDDLLWDAGRGIRSAVRRLAARVASLWNR